MDRGLYAEEHEAFRDTAREFVAREVTPNLAKWERERLIGRETLTARMDATTAITSIAPETVVLLTTKVNASEAALRPIADLVRDDTTIVCIDRRAVQRTEASRDRAQGQPPARSSLVGADQEC